MKVKSTGSPGRAGGTSWPKPQRILLPSPSPALCGPGVCVAGIKFLLFHSLLVAKWGPEGGTGRTPPALPLPLSVPLVGQCGWGELPHPWSAGPGHHWHLGSGDSVVGSEALCLIWSSECISIKNATSCDWTVQGPQDKTTWFFRKSEVRMTLRVTSVCAENVVLRGECFRDSKHSRLGRTLEHDQLVSWGTACKLKSGFFLHGSALLFETLECVSSFLTQPSSEAVRKYEFSDF